MKNWRKCTTCKKEIGFSQLYWVCNVSTCNRKRTGLVFCEVACWDAHVPVLNHRESWAEERRAPTEKEYEAILLAESQPVKRPRKSVQEGPELEPQGPKTPAPVILRKRASE
jgi:hypothetical protein